MIKQLNIHNFQSHEDSSLNFTEGVNVIIGASDSGKSAIIRALKFVVYNSPSGSDMRSWWGGETSVEIFTDNAFVARVKGKEEKYLLGDTVFKAFRTDVPKEIQDVLNMSGINLQQQLDSPFLLSLPPGQVADHFNRIAKIDQINRGLSKVNKSITDLKSSWQYTKTDLEEKEKELENYSYLEKMEAEIEVLEQMENHCKSLENSESEIKEKIDDYRATERLVNEHQMILQDEKKVNDLLDLLNEENHLTQTQKEIEKLTVRHASLRDQIQNDQELIEDEPTVNHLLNLYDKIKPLNEAISSLSKQLRRLEVVNLQLEKENVNLANLKREFQESMPDVCPLCGSHLSKNK